MSARISRFAFSVIDAVAVEVQVQIAAGLASFVVVVDLPDKAAGEARERVRAALTSMGLSLPLRRITVNFGTGGSIEGRQPVASILRSVATRRHLAC